MLQRRRGPVLSRALSRAQGQSFRSLPPEIDCMREGLCHVETGSLAIVE